MKLLNSPQLSAFGGMNFVLEFLTNKGIPRVLNRHLPKMSNQAKYSWSDIFYGMSIIYLCGGKYLEDINSHLRPHFEDNPYIKLPSSDTITRRLKQLAVDNQTGRAKRGEVDHQFNVNDLLSDLNVHILKQTGCLDQPVLTLDYDNTIIFNEKQDSNMTYKRDYGYQPGVCTINEDQILYVENRNGNSDAKTLQADTLQRVFELIDKHKIPQPNHFRADAASYQFDVIDLVQSKVKYFYIGCRNSYVEKYFSQVTHWTKLNDDIEVGQIDFTPFLRQAKENKTQPKRYRLVVKRSPKDSKQVDLMTQTAYDYRAIITNNFGLTPVEVAHFYNHRGNMERQFDILKNDFGWNQMPFSSIKYNQVFLVFTAMIRNLFKMIIHHFSKKCTNLNANCRLKRFIFTWIILPCKWVKSARIKKLRIYGKINFTT